MSHDSTVSAAHALDSFLHDIGMVVPISVVSPVHGDSKVQIILTENQVHALMYRLDKGDKA